MGRPRGFLRRMRLAAPFALSQSSFCRERQAVSAHAPLPVLAASTKPSRSLAPSWVYQKDTVNSVRVACHASGMEKARQRFAAGDEGEAEAAQGQTAVETGRENQWAIAAPWSAKMRYGPDPRISMQASGKHQSAASTGRTHESA